MLRRQIPIHQDRCIFQVALYSWTSPSVQHNTWQTHNTIHIQQASQKTCFPLQFRVARFFLVSDTKTGKMDQISSKCT
jgi:hypothetical protein